MRAFTCVCTRAYLRACACITCGARTEEIQRLGTRTASTASTLAAPASVQQVPVSILITHAVAAVKGFFRAISLHPDSADLMQDALRLLGIWFAHGGYQQVRRAAG